jgi:hypothetical protein
MRLRESVRLIAIAMAMVLGVGCVQSDSGSGSGIAGLFGGSHVTVPGGTTLAVRLDQTLSSESVRRGDPWEGVVTRAVVVDGREVIPSGATVEGMVVAAEEARRGSRARLELGVRAVRIGDRKTALDASSDPVIAGSPRARNLGAIVGGAAAGALIGEATSDNAGKGALLGGALATGAVAASKGYQVVLRDGTEMTFVINRDVAVKVG